MFEETKLLLDKFYTPYNQRLAALLNNDDFLWGAPPIPHSQTKARHQNMASSDGVNQEDNAEDNETTEDSKDDDLDNDDNEDEKEIHADLKIRKKEKKDTGYDNAKLESTVLSDMLGNKNIARHPSDDNEEDDNDEQLSPKLNVRTDKTKNTQNYEDVD